MDGYNQQFAYNDLILIFFFSLKIFNFYVLMCNGYKVGFLWNLESCYEFQIFFCREFEYSMFCLPKYVHWTVTMIVYRPHITTLLAIKLWQSYKENVSVLYRKTLTFFFGLTLILCFYLVICKIINNKSLQYFKVLVSQYKI